MANPINWKEISRKAIWGFFTAFIFMAIVAANFISGFAAFDREVIDAGPLTLNLLMQLILYIGYPILISVFLVERKLSVFIKIALFFTALLIILKLISIFTPYENFAAISSLAIFAFIPVYHLLRFKEAKISKYLLGLATGILSLIIVIPFALVSYFFLLLLVSPFILNEMVNAVWIALSAGLAVALYWFLIGIEEEFYAKRQISKPEPQKTLSDFS